jgi:UDPglucose--hexose-1-phosphate uridylyltransferase
MELSKDGETSWFVRVFPNQYPIVSGDASSELPRGAQPVRGEHEVIVETPHHQQDVAQRRPQEIALMLGAYRERLNVLQSKPGIRYVSLFRNRGKAAGSSLEHPHSQIIGLPYVPREIASRVERWRQHFADTGSCLLCDELSSELDVDQRIVRRQGGFLLYAPFASTVPGELVLAPESHVASFGAESDETLSKLGQVLLSAVQRLQSALDGTDYNFVVQTWPVEAQADPALHWYLRVIPRRTVLGGFELSTGDFVSTLTPEQAAEAYRSAASRDELK